MIKASVATASGGVVEFDLPETYQRSSIEVS